MTVSSTISVFCRDGVFRTVYCHLHGELRIPLYSITDWHRSPISDSHPFDQPET